MLDSRKRLDAMKERFVNSGLYEDLLDAVMSVIATSAESFVEEYRYNATETEIALQEMIGIVDEYTTDEIDALVADEG